MTRTNPRPAPTETSNKITIEWETTVTTSFTHVFTAVQVADAIGVTPAELHRRLHNGTDVARVITETNGLDGLLMDTEAAAMHEHPSTDDRQVIHIAPARPGDEPEPVHVNTADDFQPRDLAYITGWGNTLWRVTGHLQATPALPWAADRVTLETTTPDGTLTAHELPHRLLKFTPPPVQGEIHSGGYDSRYRVYTVGHIPFDFMPAYNAGGPAITALGARDVHVSYADGTYTLRIRNWDASPRHDLDGTVYDTELAAEKAAYNAGLTGFMVYETKAALYNLPTD